MVNDSSRARPRPGPRLSTSVRPGGFYGWPYSYFGQHLDPRVRPLRPDLVAKAIKPDYRSALTIAPLGFNFTPRELPRRVPRWRISWRTRQRNRKQLNGYLCGFHPLCRGPTDWPAIDFATGFVRSGGGARAGRLAWARSRGALLVADDFGNAVWRIIYEPGERPKLAAFSLRTRGDGRHTRSVQRNMGSRSRVPISMSGHRLRWSQLRWRARLA